MIQHCPTTAAGPAAGAAVWTAEFQRDLAVWNRARLAPGFPVADDRAAEALEQQMRLAEAAFVRELRSQVVDAAAEVPTAPGAFAEWYEGLKRNGPGQNDPLFPWLATAASKAELRWFCEQEAAGEAGFDDLVALTQVKMPIAAKLELARNYWDEMGRGDARGMHGPMLDRLAEALGAEPAIERTVAESLALANAMTAMATRRDLAWHSIGALGVIELTAPTRAVMVAAGLRRIGLDGRQRHYFDLHAVLDVKHSIAWVREVIATLIAEDPARARFIAEGALIRLHCGERCYQRYRRELWAADSPPAATGSAGPFAEAA